MRVLIIQAQMKAYRQPFFEQLHSKLAAEGVELYVAYGRPSKIEESKKDNVDLPSAFSVRVRNLWLFSDKILYQPVWKAIFESDLVIVEHANKHMINYALMALSVCGLKKLAFWGHGRNLQGSERSLTERFKICTLRASDWWFAYTKGAGQYLQRRGVSEQKITVVQNSIDTNVFRSDVYSLDAREAAEYLKSDLGFPDDARVAIYCGGLYEKKCLPFLIECGKILHADNPRFRLIIAGDGPMKEYIQKSAETESWLRYVGAVFGRDKARCFSVANVFLCPGLVGLAILDAFAAGLPVVTTNVGWHSPEIEYLEDGVNGLMLSHDVHAYTNGVSKILNEPSFYAELQCGANDSGTRYTMDSMVDNFSQGVLSCLKST